MIRMKAVAGMAIAVITLAGCVTYYPNAAALRDGAAGSATRVVNVPVTTAFKSVVETARLCWDGGNVRVDVDQPSDKSPGTIALRSAGNGLIMLAEIVAVRDGAEITIKSGKQAHSETMAQRMAAWAVGGTSCVG